MKNWKTSHFFCELCFSEGEFTNVGRNQIEVCQGWKTKRLQKFALGNYSQDINDRFVAQKTEQRTSFELLKNYRGKFTLNFLSKDDLHTFTYHNKHQILELVRYAIRFGLKDGYKLSKEQKIIVFLMIVKLDLSSAVLGAFFDVDASTISRCRNEVTRCLKVWLIFAA